MQLRRLSRNNLRKYGKKSIVTQKIRMHLLSTFNVVQRFNLYKKEKTYDIAAVRFFCLCKKGN